jgi:metal-responsive CopG/Arc/MetJ family transcriptional regulator
MTIVTFDCPADLIEKLDNYARKQNRKRSDVIRLILKEKLLS